MKGARLERLVILAAIGTLTACSDSTAPKVVDETVHGPAVAIEVSPGAILLTATGQQQKLTAFAIDSAGTRTPISAVFESSNPGVISVSADGLATSTSATGSSQVIARADGLVSAPILAVAAQPVEGAMLIADSQVVGTIEPVDLAARYGPGWRYRVRLRSVMPVNGQILLGSGGSMIAGRTISVADTVGYRIVTLELLQLREMFANLSVKETVPLQNVRRISGLPSAKSASASSVNIPRASALASPDVEFNIGQVECKATPGISASGLSLEVGSLTVDPSLGLDIDITSAGLQRLAVTGTITAKQKVKISATATLTGTVDCHGIVATIPFPVGGLLGFFVGGALPLGAGFSLGGELTTANIGAELDLTAVGSVALGVDCTGICRPLADFQSSTSGSSIKPILPSLSGAFKVKIKASAYGYTEFKVGNPLFELLQFGLVEAKSGLTQELDLASREFQAADTAYASSLTLTPFISAGTTLELQEAAGMLGFAIPELKFEPQLEPIATSPKGTFRIAPADVQAGTSTALGQTAIFTLALEPVTYVGSYSVEEVEIRWKKRATDGTITLDPGRPGCTTIPVTPGQFAFSCSTDFLEEQSGPQTFYAFVKARIFGVVIPVQLEIAPNAAATVSVTRSGLVTSGGSGNLTTGAGGPNPDVVVCNKSLNGAGTQSSLSQSDNCLSTYTYIFTLNGRTDTITYVGKAAQTYAYEASGSSVSNLRLHVNGSSTSSVSESKTGGGLPVTARSRHSRSVCFVLTGNTRYDLSGSLATTGILPGFNDSDYAEVGLFNLSTSTMVSNAKSGDVNFFNLHYPASVAIAGSGTLSAGSYCVLVDARAMLESSAVTRNTSVSFDVVLQLSPP